MQTSGRTLGTAVHVAYLAVLYAGTILFGGAELLVALGGQELDHSFDRALSLSLVLLALLSLWLAAYAVVSVILVVDGIRMAKNGLCARGRAGVMRTKVAAFPHFALYALFCLVLLCTVFRSSEARALLVLLFMLISFFLRLPASVHAVLWIRVLCAGGVLPLRTARLFSAAQFFPALDAATALWLCRRMVRADGVVIVQNGRLR